MVEEIARLQEQIKLLTQKVLHLLEKNKPEPIRAPMSPDEIEKPDVAKKDMGMWIYNVAKSHIGRDMSKTQDSKGCVESCLEILRRAGVILDVKGGLSTAEAYKSLEESEVFDRIDASLDEAIEGDIIISPTGLGVGSGHMGIMSDSDKIMSNRSKDSIWSEHLTKQIWYDYFSKEKNFPIFCYRHKG